MAQLEHLGDSSSAIPFDINRLPGSIFISNRLPNKFFEAGYIFSSSKILLRLNCLKIPSETNLQVAFVMVDSFLSADKVTYREPNYVFSIYNRYLWYRKDLIVNF
jgi:hypothetical protein